MAEGLAARGCSAAALDLPGFGDATDDERYDVAAMADAVMATVESLQPRAHAGGAGWLLVGHSMGGKVAAVVARAAADGDPRVRDLAGLVLVSPSPPSPEPIGEDKRQQLLADLGGPRGADAEEHARDFVTANVGAPPLAAATLERATVIVLSMNRAALRAWLTAGSNEDWAASVGRLPQPLLVMYGGAESPLGGDAQRAFLERHAGDSSAAGPVPAAELVELVGAGHLGPVERPGVIVDRIDRFAASLGLRAQLSRETSQLVTSPLTSPATRAVLLERIVPAEVLRSQAAFGPEALATLRALVARVVPGAPAAVASRVHRSIAEGPGDGFRPAVLNEDRVAWSEGLASLEAAAWKEHELGFVALEGARQDALLEALASTPRGKAWFDDARAEIVRMYVSDPRTLERIGFRGFADEQGFTQIRLGEREEFE